MRLIFRNEPAIYYLSEQMLRWMISTHTPQNETIKKRSTGDIICRQPTQLNDILNPKSFQNEALSKQKFRLHICSYYSPSSSSSLIMYSISTLYQSSSVYCPIRLSIAASIFIPVLFASSNLGFSRFSKL